MSRRAEPIVLALLVAASWTGSLLLGRAPDAARAGDPTAAGESAYEAAREAAERRDWSAAGDLLRTVWDDPSVRDKAAAALRALEEADRLSPAIDESALGEIRSLLGSGFSRRETEHFVLLTDAGPSAAARQAGILERTYRQFFRVMDRLEFPAAPPRRKLQVVVFSDHAMYEAFARPRDSVETRWVAGYYATATNRAVIYDASSGPAYAQARETLAETSREVSRLRAEARTVRRDGDAARAAALSARAEQLERHLDSERRRLAAHADAASTSKLVHEAAHLLAFNTGLQSRSREHPFWLTEGLATVFETGDAGAAFGPDHVEAEGLAEARELASEGRLIPLATFMTLTEAPPDGSIAPARLYAQARALFAYLFRFERAGLRSYLLEILEAPPTEDPAPRRKRLRRHFGDLGGLERGLTRWLLS